jgi:hypothetical protein
MSIRGGKTSGLYRAVGLAKYFMVYLAEIASRLDQFRGSLPVLESSFMTAVLLAFGYAYIASFVES